MIDEDESLPEREIFSNYVPTSYNFLEKIFSYFPFDLQDHIIDFGCGKGRMLFMAAHNSCKYVTGYEINEIRYEILINNIKKYQNRFFFFSPFHLKIYMKVFNNLLSSIKNNPRNISVYLYKPYKNIIEYLDSIDILHKEAFVEYTFTSPNNHIFQTPQFVIYSNYDMGHSLNEYSISL